MWVLLLVLAAGGTSGSITGIGSVRQEGRWMGTEQPDRDVEGESSSRTQEEEKEVLEDQRLVREEGELRLKGGVGGWRGRAGRGFLDARPC